jgi:hypothetical protein
LRLPLEDQVQEALSHESYVWTRVHAFAQTKRALGALPFRIDLLPLGGHQSGPRLVLVHAPPTLNTLYWGADRSDTFCLKMPARAALKGGDAIAFGQTHIGQGRGGPGGVRCRARGAWDPRERAARRVGRRSPASLRAAAELSSPSC